MTTRTPAQVKGYDLFKLFVAAVLLIIIIVLLIRWNTPRTTAAPMPIPLAQMTLSPTLTQTPTATPRATSAPSPTSVPTPTPTAPPAVSAPTLDLPDSALTVGELTLSGTGTPGSTVRVIIDGRVAGTAVVGQGGKWSLPLVMDEPGRHGIELEAVDNDGNVVAATGALSVDITPSIAPLRMNAPELGEFLSAGGEQATGSLATSGQGEPGTVVQVWADDQMLGSTIVGSDGSWAFGESVTLPAGGHKVFVQMRDADGNLLAASDPVVVEIEGKPDVATPTWASPGDGAELQAGVVELRGTGQPGTEIEILDAGAAIGAAMVQDDGIWTFEYRLEVGTHALAVRNARDPGGSSQTVRVEVTSASEPGESGGASTEAARCPADPPHGIDRGTTYVVARCEYMSLIAGRTGVTLQDLIAANPQVANPVLIYPGQVLNLPPRNE
jgi:hypothetical protein